MESQTEPISVQNIDEIDETLKISFRQRVEKLLALRRVKPALLGLGLLGAAAAGALLIAKFQKPTPTSSPIPTPKASPTLTSKPTPTSIPTQAPTPTLFPTPTPRPPTPTPEPAPLTSYGIPVLVLKYFPIKDGKLDPDITGMNDNLATIRAGVDKLTAEIIDALEKGSAYHGYKDPTPTALLDYFVIEEKEFLTAMPLSDNEIPWNPGIYRPNYYQILSELDVCDYVENKGIKEVWVWGYHHGELEPAESNMAGPYGDISNSEGIDDMPTCSKSYTLYNYNYQRGLGEALEDHTHQMEALFKHVDRDTFWGKFVGRCGNQEYYRCGWTHYPPNVMEFCGGHDYDWSNERAVLSDCEDWNPDGSGEKKRVDCHTWAGDDCNQHSPEAPNSGGAAFKVWWMQNIPSGWWDFITDFDRAIQSDRELAL